MGFVESYSVFQRDIFPAFYGICSGGLLPFLVTTGDAKVCQWTAFWHPWYTGTLDNQNSP